MLFIKRAKILSTRLYEFFEGGCVNPIPCPRDYCIGIKKPATVPLLGKTCIFQIMGEGVVH